MLLTYGAIAATKVTYRDHSGFITVPGIGLKQMMMGNGQRAAGLASAVHLHNLYDYVTLPPEELRNAQDVVFDHNGDFHFYRVAGISRLHSGGVRIAALDRTVVQVEIDGQATVEPRWSHGEDINMTSLSLQAPDWIARVNASS